MVKLFFNFDMLHMAPNKKLQKAFNQINQCLEHLCNKKLSFEKAQSIIENLLSANDEFSIAISVYFFETTLNPELSPKVSSFMPKFQLLHELGFFSFLSKIAFEKLFQLDEIYDHEQCIEFLINLKNEMYSQNEEDEDATNEYKHPLLRAWDRKNDQLKKITETSSNDDHAKAIKIAVCTKKYDRVIDYLINNFSAYSSESSLIRFIQNKEILTALIKKNPDYIHAENTEISLFTRAFEEKNLDLIDILLQHNANVLHKTFFCSGTIFHRMARFDQMDFAMKFVERYPEFSDAIYSKTSEIIYMNQMPLHIAITSGSFNWIEKTLTHDSQLVNLIDDEHHSLAFYVIRHIKDLPKLLKLLEEHGFSWKNRDTFGANLLEYAADAEKIPILTWIDTSSKFKLEMEDKFQLLLRAINSRQLSVIRWLLNFSWNNDNIAQIVENLAISKLHEFIIEYDLFRKNPTCLFTRYHADSTLFEFVLASTGLYDGDDPNDNQHAKALLIFKYAYDYLKENKIDKSLDDLKDFELIIRVFLKNKLMLVNDVLNDGIPLFHHWESHVYQSYQVIAHNPNITEELALDALKHYHSKIEMFVKKYKPNVNCLASDGSHLFARLFTKDNVYLRIRSLIEHISGFEDADNDNPFLLYLACEYEHLQLIQWMIACNKFRNINTWITKAREKDDMSPLDIVVRKGNRVIYQYLLGTYNTQYGWQPRLSLNQQKTYLTSLKQKKWEDILTCVKPYLIDTSKPKLVCKIEEEINSQEEVVNETASKAVLTLNQIKILKQKNLQAEELSIISEQFITLISASNYKYSVLYQLLRIHGIQFLFEKHADKLQELLYSAIETRDVRTICLLLKKQVITDVILEQIGFSLLAQLLNKNITSSSMHKDDEAIMLMLLNHPIIASMAAQNKNELLLNAAKKGFTTISMKLLSLPNVMAFANEYDNDALRGAINTCDLELFEKLLQLPCVLHQLKETNYDLIREIYALIEHNKNIDADFDYEEFTCLIRQIPGLDLKNFLNEIELNEINEFETSEMFFPRQQAYSAAIYLMFPVYIPFYIDKNALDMHALYDAIICDDAYWMETLLMNIDSQLHDKLIYEFAEFAIAYGKQHVLSRLLEMSVLIFQAHPSLSNRLICQAIRTRNLSTIDLLINFEPVQKSAHYYNNRLLRLCINYELTEQALVIINNSTLVQKTLTTLNNYALRRAIMRENTVLVEKLLTYKHVCERVSAFNYAALRKACYVNRLDIALMLLAIPEVMKFAETRMEPFYTESINKYLQSNTVSMLISKEDNVINDLEALKKHSIFNPKLSNIQVSHMQNSYQH